MSDLRSGVENVLDKIKSSLVGRGYDLKEIKVFVERDPFMEMINIYVIKKGSKKYFIIAVDIECFAGNRRALMRYVFNYLDEAGARNNGERLLGE